MSCLEQSGTRVTFLGPDPTHQKSDPTQPARHDSQLSDVVTGQSGHGPVACLTLGDSEIAAAASCCKSAVNRPVLIEHLMPLE